MPSELLPMIWRFILSIFLQITLFSHMSFLGWLSPYPYLWALLLYPIQLPRWTSLIVGFSTGLLIDLFLNTGGIHASASLFMMTVRINVLSFVVPQSSYEDDSGFSIPDMEIPRFATYAGLLALIHHVWLFGLEIFQFNKLPTVLLKAIPAAAMTLIFVLIFRLLLIKSGRKYQ